MAEPYCLDCEAMLIPEEWYAAPYCTACRQRAYAEAWAEVEAEQDAAWQRGIWPWLFLDGPDLKWGRFWHVDGWVWMSPMEFLAWCQGSQADTDPTIRYD